MTKMFKKEIWIFLSHSSEDFNRVRQIRNYLEERNYRPLMFYLKCLDTEEEIYSLITREIDVRTRFILCDSENARNSIWVKREMDYISNQDPPRSYLRIDLSQSDELIYQQLEKYLNQMNVYVSCTRKYFDFFCKIQKRLNKYDLKVLPDFESINVEASFALEVEKQITHAANNGYFIILYSKDSSQSRYVIKEIECAKNKSANIILITLDKESTKAYLDNIILHKYPHIHVNVSEFLDEDKADAATNLILSNILPIGGMMTFADNFRIGRFGLKDKKEAQEIYRFLFKLAEKSDNPHALTFMGRCYEYGLCGEIDLQKAYMYYTTAIHEPGGPKDEQFLMHVRELNKKINQDKNN